jgi:integrating conjugative element protein (TIGR03765 family)
MKISFAAFLLAGVAVQATAALTVVADLGGESTAPLYAAIQPEGDTRHPPSVAGPKALTETDLLPIVSTRLHPGDVSSRAMSLPGFSPLFLIGDDSRSRRWLQQHRQKLVSINATGLVVSVAGAEQLADLRQLAPDLTLLPVSGDDIAQRLHLSAYPVLLDENGLSQ